LISYFSGKSLRLMPPDALISSQNAPNCIWRPGYAHNATTDPLTGFKGSYF